MSILRWSIKDSLLGYVRAMQDGRIVVDGGVTEVGHGFEFAGTDDPLRFAGRVTLTGHSGMMRVAIADPAIVQSVAGWILEIADPDDPVRRMSFATLTGFDGVTAEAAVLTDDGADLFFGPYEAGTPVDVPAVAD
ncbi:HtaA domain-containing protein [Arthrobacter sp. TMT4-20]